MQTTTLNNIKQETLSHLNDLVQINMDSHDGFTETADQPKSDMFKSLFRDIAEERKRQADELRGLVENNDGDAPESGSLTAQAHRWWTQLRDKVSDSPNYAVLAEAERGEDKILHLYQDVLDEVKDTPAYDVVTQHKAQVKERHDQIRDLRDQAKKQEDRD